MMLDTLKKSPRNHSNTTILMQNVETCNKKIVFQDMYSLLLKCMFVEQGTLKK